MHGDIRKYSRNLFVCELVLYLLFFFFFQAEDGIRDLTVTGVQTCALPISTQTMTKEAVLASQAAICVAQFMKQPNHEKKLKELGDVSSWQRAEVIEKGGWDKMPGQAKAGYAVARACADGLELLIKK